MSSPPKPNAKDPNVAVEISIPLSISPDPTYYVAGKTSQLDRIKRVIDVSDGGVIGVTGERGAGKSVLLNKLIEDYEKVILTMKLAAPVSSSKDMEFFVMLFRQLTQHVVMLLKKRAKANLDEISILGREAFQQQRQKAFTRVGLTALGIIIALWIALSFWDVSKYLGLRQSLGLSSSIWGLVFESQSRLLLRFYPAMFVVFLAFVVLAYPTIVSLISRDKLFLNLEERGLLIYSERLSERLDYEMTRSVEGSVEMSPAKWFKSSLKRSKQETARGLSLPELTASYIDFVAYTLRVFPSKLLVCIDELDKVTDLDQVRLILREIKGALYVKGTFYLLSISNDALRSFEGRLGDQRDIFESTFDDVFPVRPLDLATCLDILHSRLQDQPISNSLFDTKQTFYVISIFSAGNARDLVRNFRECILSNEKGILPLADVAWTLLFSRRRDSIQDRVSVSEASWSVRSRVVSLLENRDLIFGDEEAAADGCKELREHIQGGVQDMPPSLPGRLAQERLVRFLIEIEILLNARIVISKMSEPGDIVASENDVKRIMRAYQLLPYSTEEALSVLYGNIDVESASDLLSDKVRRESLSDLSSPVSERK
jgi:KAP family P-loop domain